MVLAEKFIYIMKIRRSALWLLRWSWRRGFAVFLPLLKPTGLSGPGWELWFPFGQLHSAFRNGCLTFVQVVIEGTRGPSYLGDIGIDDIGFSNFPCHPATSQWVFFFLLVSTLVHMQWLRFQTSLSPIHKSVGGFLTDCYTCAHALVEVSNFFVTWSPVNVVVFSLFFLLISPTSFVSRPPVKDFSYLFPHLCTCNMVEVSNFPCHPTTSQCFFAVSADISGRVLLWWFCCLSLNVWLWGLYIV